MRTQSLSARTTAAWLAAMLPLVMILVAWSPTDARAGHSEGAAVRPVVPEDEIAGV